MDIAFSTDQNYFRYTYIAIVSIFESNPSEAIAIHILSSGLTPSQISLLDQLSDQYHQIIHYYQLGEDAFPQDAPRSPDLSVEAYYRLLIPTVLDYSIDRLLYLDVDTNVHGTLAPLFDAPFNINGKEYLFLACRDTTSIQLTNLFADLLSENDFHYVNSGVLMINLKKWRESYNATSIINEITKLSDQLAFADQDYINYKYHNDISLLDDMQYNLITRPAYNSGYTYEWVKKNNTILHYAGEKPWDHTKFRINLDQFWWNSAKKSPFYTELLEELVLNEIKTCYMDTYFRELKRENDELSKLANDCLTILQQTVGKNI